MSAFNIVSGVTALREAIEHSENVSNFESITVDGVHIARIHFKSGENYGVTMTTEEVLKHARKFSYQALRNKGSWANNTDSMCRMHCVKILWNMPEVRRMFK